MSDDTTQRTTTFNPIDFTVTAPVQVGCWDSGGGMKICLTKRPNWFHQKMGYIFSGWKWTDNCCEQKNP